MAIRPQDLPNVILALRWGFLTVALVCIFVLEWMNVGLALAGAGLVFSIAMRSKACRDWFAAKVMRGRG